MASGESLVDSDSPTGETISSPMVATSMISAIHHTDTAATETWVRKIRNAEPMRISPTPNLVAVTGWRLPKVVHR